MLAAVGHPVMRLQRSAYAGLTVEGLEPGACRELEPSEVAGLRGAGGAPQRSSGRGSSA
jgi:23S rRNA pseudouridine2605 synthase